MSIKPNRTGSVLSILPLMCAISFTAFGADELQSQARQGRNQDPLFLTATNGANNLLAVVNTRSKQISFVPTGGIGGASGNAGGVAVSGQTRGGRQLRLLQRHDLRAPRQCHGAHCR